MMMNRPDSHLRHGLRRFGRLGVRMIATMVAALLFMAGCCWLPPASVEDAIELYGRRGHSAYNEGRYLDAAAAWQKGLDAARQGRRSADAARFLVDLSLASEGVGRYAAALDQASAALELLGEGGDPATRCRALMQKGLAYRRTARYAAARPYFDRALAIARRLEDSHLESESLRNIAALLQDQGQLEAALKYYEDALALARAHGDETSEARSLNNLGTLFDDQAEYPKALARHQASLVLRRKIGDRAGEGKVLGNICITYAKLNQLTPAMAHCKAALKVAGNIGDRQREANHLNNIGTIYRKLNQPRKALRYYQRALKIKQDLSDSAGEAGTLNNIGEIYWHLGKLDAAEEHLERSLKIKAAIGDDAGQSASHQNLALLYSRRGAYTKAKSHYMKAIFFNNRAGRPELTWRAYDGLSYVYQSLSKPDLAILYGKQALRSIQETRSRLDSLEKSLRQSYLSDKVQVYRHVADLLIQEGRLSEAQQVVSLLKEEEYWHYLDTRSAGEASVDDVVTTITEQHWTEEIAAFDGELGRLGYEIELLETQQRRDGLSEVGRQRLFQLYDTADEVQQAFEAYLLELESDYDNKVEFGKKDLDSLASLQGDLGELDARTVVVTFLVLEDNISILITAPAVQIPYRVPIDEAELNQRVFDFKQRLVRADLDPRPQARALYDLLIAPIEEDLIALDAETLMISLDGTLRYLPFAALFDGEHYLTENYNLALFTPAAKTLPGETEPRDLRIAGLGMSHAAEGFSRLPAVEEELDLIVREDDNDDPRGVLPGRILLNRNFTAESLSEILGQGYPIIHLASHFSFRPGIVKDSFVLLGDGNRLTLADLESRRYPFKFIELLTLSACDTAVGGEDAQGREIESFATLAQKRGAGAILATLWPVADASTGVFMSLFYQMRNELRLSKAEALREVQSIFISGTHDAEGMGPEHRGIREADGDGGGFTPPPGAPFAHPFYWAPFILMGNFL
ncbi:CHAT domain-containing protein [uncultured Desulfobacter sp.]|uniref:CHAT domain-containing protein n=1 Tax=uncultured Desulfobacter sp. TaxID=240139 RepID=UPI0029C871E6|nr:CHAT domain-containing protein [uncultured Desulfobacter sp.]